MKVELREKMSWKGCIDKVNEAMCELMRYDVEFIDDKGFSEFLDHLKGLKGTRFSDRYNSDFRNLDITGYFSVGISDLLCDRSEKCRANIRLISPTFGDATKKPDYNNLTALRKMQDAGIEIKVNDMLHARLFVGYNQEVSLSNDILLLGSFDFNREGLSGEKRNAGIITRNPDLVKSAREFFEGMWTDSHYTKSLNEKYPLK
jgi:hypothetical protein